MGRPPLPIGTYGAIATQNVGPAQYKARARYRGRDGKTVTVARFGQTKGEATNRLRAALAELARNNGADTLTGQARIREIANRWLEEVDASTRATQTRSHYRYTVERYVIPRLGDLRIAEATTGRCDEALQQVKAVHGAGAARSARAVLNGIFGLAVRHGALTVNPVRETRAIASAKGQARALTEPEVDDLSDQLRADPRAVLLDLPDLVDFALATGCRIGEILAIRDPVLDLDAGTIEINATAIRIPKVGVVVQERPKSAAGWRVLALPPFAVDMLQRRRGELRLNPPAVRTLAEDGKTLRADPVWLAFPAALARTVRDPSNTSGDLREVLDRIGCDGCGGRGWHAELKTDKQRAQAPAPRTDEHGQVWHEPCAGDPPYSWVTSHVFRKTVATRLDEAGLSAREIADQLGHAQPSLTQDRYMGRRVVSARAAALLDR